MRIVGLCIAVTVGLPALARADSALAPQGETTVHRVPDDVLFDAFHEIPDGDGLTYLVSGPGRVVFFFVNHRRLKKRKKKSPTTVRLRVDGGAPFLLKLDCESWEASFGGPSAPTPCAPRHRSFELESGDHVMSLRIGKSPRGASVSARFVPPDDMLYDPSLTAPATENDWVATEETPADALSLIAIEELPPAPAAATATAPPPESPAVRAFTNPLTLILAGVGIAALATGAVFGIQSQSAFTTAGLPETPQTDTQRLNENGSRDGIIANSLFGAGGLALIIGGIIFALDLTEEPDSIEDSGDE